MLLHHSYSTTVACHYSCFCLQKENVGKGQRERERERKTLKALHFSSSPLYWREDCFISSINPLWDIICWMETTSLHEADIVLISIVINKLFHFHCWQLENKLFFILKDLFFKSLLIESRGDGCFPSVFSIGAEAKLEARRPGATRKNQAFHQIPLYVFCILAFFFFFFLSNGYILRTLNDSIWMS